MDSIRNRTNMMKFYVFLVSVEFELFELAKLVGSSWRELGQHLGLNADHLDCIERDIFTTRERAIKMLDDWYCACGRRINLDDVRSKVVELRRSKRSANQEKERKCKHKSFT